MKILGFIILQLLGNSNPVFQKLVELQNESEFRQSIVSMAIKNTETNQNVLLFNSEKVLAPASTQKLITTASAFESLGENFKFSTEISYSGKIINGNLDGNLYVQGNGDPSFGSERNSFEYQEIFSAWADKIKSLGINSVNGRLIIDQSEWLQYDLPNTWQWGDLGNYYGALPYNININENMFKAYFSAGSELGMPANLEEIIPTSSSWQIINQVTTAERGTGDNVYIYISPFSSTILMKGTIPFGSRRFRVKGAIPQPLQFFEEKLEEALNDKGIIIKNVQNFSFYDPKTTIDQLYSKPLKELAIDCNFESINFYADAFAKAVARKRFSFPTFKNVGFATQNIWYNKGLFIKELEVKDGSGLSPMNRFTTQNMVDILNVASSQNYFPSFYESIPRLGYEGTVKYLDRRRVTKGNVRAKSGSISGTRAFAGYFKDKNNVTYAFMIGITGYENEAGSKARNRMAAIMRELPNL